MSEFFLEMSARAYRFFQSLSDMGSNESCAATHANLDAAVDELFRVLGLEGGEGEAGVDLCHGGG